MSKGSPKKNRPPSTASTSAKKRLEKISGSQFTLLRSLTEDGDLSASGVDAMIHEIVADRFAMARATLEAARLLARSRDPLVRRSTVSRAYYAAYQAARGAFLSVHRRDEDDHDRLGKEIASLKGLTPDVTEALRELRRLRNEFDYSPYPGLDLGTPYEPATIEATIKKSIRDAQGVIRALWSLLKQRG